MLAADARVFIPETQPDPLKAGASVMGKCQRRSLADCRDGHWRGRPAADGSAGAMKELG